MTVSLQEGFETACTSSQGLRFPLPDTILREEQGGREKGVGRELPRLRRGNPGPLRYFVRQRYAVIAVLLTAASGLVDDFVVVDVGPIEVSRLWRRNSPKRERVGGRERECNVLSTVASGPVPPRKLAKSRREMRAHCRRGDETLGN